MTVRLVGAEHYRGEVDGRFVELRRGDELQVSPEAAEALFEFPGWFAEVDGGRTHGSAPTTADDERQAKAPKQDRMQRGGGRDR